MSISNKPLLGVIIAPMVGGFIFTVLFHETGLSTGASLVWAHFAMAVTGAAIAFYDLWEEFV